MLSSEEKLISEESRRNMLAEYAALRSEITTFLTIQVQFMAVSLTLASALAGLFITKLSFEVLAFLPLPFLTFGLLYGDAKARILRAASYICHDLRPTLVDSADESHDLMWESFVREGSKLKSFLSVAEIVRWAVFCAPPSGLIIYLILNLTTKTQHRGLIGILIAAELFLLFLLLRTAHELDKYEKNLLHEKQK